jgi:hypothetical protein
VPWFKVDDELHDHRKARLAGAHAMGLWVLSGSWCGANPNDGFIPESVVIRWEPKAYRKLAARLVDAGLWSVDTLDGEAGWRFHDWGDFQPTKAEIDAEKAAARDRMRARRAKAKGVDGSPDVRANTTTNTTGTTDEGTPAVPGSRPVPARPVPIRGGRATSATTDRPEPWCPRHPGGTDDPCGPCGVARKAALAWQPPTPMPPSVAELRAQGVIR